MWWGVTMWRCMKKKGRLRNRARGLGLKEEDLDLGKRTWGKRTWSKRTRDMCLATNDLLANHT
jgi:hypothetical protein